MVVWDLDAIYADQVRPGVSVRNINNERGPHGRSRSEGLAADPPEADSGRDDGEAEEDRRLAPLEGPEAVGGLLGDQVPEMERAECGLAGLG